MDTNSFHAIITDIKWLFDTMGFTPYLMIVLFIGVVYAFYTRFFGHKD